MLRPATFTVVTKLIVQIPCLNEEETLPLVLENIPTDIKGVDEIETLVIDDGSTDRTVQVAAELGVNHIIRHRTNRGLARSFADGIDHCLKLGADIIVNTDGDNQYPQERIPDLVRPILDDQADLVVADRQTQTIEHFSPGKKALQRLGSKVVASAADTDIPDAASGFRAYSRQAAEQINVMTDFSYCMETIIHAGRKGLSIASVPVETNPKTRDSRLFKSNRQHVMRSASAIARAYIMHQPLKLFLSTATVFGIVGLIPFLRYLYLFATIQSGLGAHLQSLLLGAVSLTASFMMIVLGVVADLVKINRVYLEDSLVRLKRLQYTGDQSTTV